MQKLTTLRVQRYGVRGISITLPSVFASDNNILPGSALAIYRSQIDGIDSLIIPAAQFPPNLISNLNINESKNLVEVELNI